MELMVNNPKEEDMLRDIITSNGANLPANIEGVLTVFEFTDWKAKAWKIMADKMVKLEGQTEAHASALRSGQQWGIAALYAKKRIGEITLKMPKAQGSGTVASGPFKKDALKKVGLDTGTVSEAERIAGNPEVLDEVIEDAKKRNEIPTQTKVLNSIRIKEAEKREVDDKIRKVDKKIKETPRAVKEYLDEMMSFHKALSFALQVSKRDLFPPESISMLMKRHSEIRAFMQELEESINER